MPFGVGVQTFEVVEVDRSFGCYPEISHLLVLPINKVDGYKDVIDLFSNRWASWKSKQLSIGGRMILSKFVFGPTLVLFPVFFGP